MRLWKNLKTRILFRGKDMGENNGVLICGEVDGDKPSSVVLELLGIGRILADALGEKLSIVFIDKNADACGQKAVSYGADTVYSVTDAPAEQFEAASHASIIEKLITDKGIPRILLLSHTMTGRVLGPMLAFRLKAGLVMDCLGLEIDPETKGLLAQKPVSGGNVLATYSFKEGGIHMATVRRKAMEPAEPDEGRQGAIENIEAGVDASAVKIKLIERVLEETEGPNIETAEIVVAGGRGMGSTQDFEGHINNGLAAVLNAGIGATRAAVDSGYITEPHQVGLTGKIVGPNLYIAIALSGAIQHMAGCSGAKNIVAINRDENAQIFKFAKFGIVADYKKVLPPLIEKLKGVL
jgi:electron transfer flavoprotein alpha subunit